MDKATDDKDAITNELIILNPPSRPTPEWMKSPETKKKVLKQRRDFHKSWARYMMVRRALSLFLSCFDYNKSWARYMMVRGALSLFVLF